MHLEPTDQQRLIQRVAKEFANKEIELLAGEIDRESKIPSDMLQKMAKARFLEHAGSEKIWRG